MLSTEDPPDPDPFSIRDYVFTTRHEHIEKNWPFPQRHLLQCSTHEIKNLLPPFEPPDSIRNRCNPPLLSQVYSNKVQASAFLEEERHLRSTPSLLQEQDTLALHHRPSGKLGSDHAAQITVAKDAQSERESDKGPPLLLPTLSESPLDPQTSQFPSPPNNNNLQVGPSGRKCRLILKLGPIADTNHIQHIKSNTTDSMASKICPVCKIYSSSSNTTLNAHIDQCLAIDSTSKWVTNVRKVTEYSTKPTKKRSMVSIYATAPRCTLEELDRRNGSNWAADKTAILKVTTDEKNHRVSDVNHTCMSDESTIYVDSNGIKLRIISNFSNVLMPTAEDEPTKRINNVKANKALPFNAEKHCQPKCIKRMKPKTRKRNLCSLESNEVEMSRARAREVKHGMEIGPDKEESTSQHSEARNEVSCSNLGTLRHWVCSKRTSRLKRVSSKDNHLDLGLPSSKSTNALSERNKRNFGGTSIGKSCTMSSASETFTNARCTKSPVYESQADGTVDSLNRHEGRLFSRKRTSSQRGGSLLRFPKSLGAFVSCPSKGVHVVAGTADNSDNFLKKSVMTTDFVVKAKPSLPNLMSKRNGNQSALRKPRIRRYIAEMDGQLGMQVLNVEKQCDFVRDSTENVPYLMGEACNLERSSDRWMHAFGEVESLNTPMATKDASQSGVQKWDVDVGATMKSQPIGISSSDPPSLPAAPGSNKTMFTQAVDRDSSTSPVSTISHSTVQRSNSQFSDIESCCGEPDVGTWRAERISFSGESCGGATMISPSEKSVKLNDDQTCCCFRRWASSFDASPTYQYPQLLKQGTTKSSVTNAKGKQMFYTSTSDMVTSPTYQSPRNSVRSPDAGHNRETQDAQSTSNPVLRLMGKNLVVVNKDVKMRQPSPDFSDTLFADSSTKHANILRLSPGSISERVGVSSQEDLLPHFVNDICSEIHQRQHSSSSNCPESEAELSSRILKAKYSSAGILPQTSSFSFHPFSGMDPNLSDEHTFRGGQHAFASYYSPTLP